MINLSRRLFSYISKKLKIYVLLSLIFSCLSALSESFTLLFLLPLINVLIQPIDAIRNNSNNLFFPNFLNLDDNFGSYLALIFAGLVTISTFLRLTSLWINNRTSALIAIYLSSRIYKAKIFQDYSQIKSPLIVKRVFKIIVKDSSIQEKNLFTSPTIHI